MQSIISTLEAPALPSTLSSVHSPQSTTAHWSPQHWSPPTAHDHEREHEAMPWSSSSDNSSSAGGLAWPLDPGPTLTPHVPRPTPHAPGPAPEDFAASTLYIRPLGGFTHQAQVVWCGMAWHGTCRHGSGSMGMGAWGHGGMERRAGSCAILSPVRLLRLFLGSHVKLGKRVHLCALEWSPYLTPYTPTPPPLARH